MSDDENAPGNATGTTADILSFEGAREKAAAFGQSLGYGVNIGAEAKDDLKQKAFDLHVSLSQHLTEICRLVNDGQAAGLTANFQLGKDWAGNTVVVGVSVMKVYF